LSLKRSSPPRGAQKDELKEPENLSKFFGLLANTRPHCFLEKRWGRVLAFLKRFSFYCVKNRQIKKNTKKKLEVSNYTYISKCHSAERNISSGASITGIYMFGKDLII